jgi:hypothetical protein
MKDLKQTLADRAGRSDPTGSERLRQRVALTLSGGGRLGAEPRRAPRGPLVAVGAAALVLAVFGVVALLLWGGDAPVAEQPPTTVPATTTVPPTTVPATTAAPGSTDPTITATTTTPPQAAAGWQIGAPDAGLSITQVEPVGESVAAHGMGGIWITDDGLRWEHRLRLDPADRVGVARIIEYDGGLIAAGSRFEPEGESELLVWASPDGSQWAESVVSAFPFPYEPSRSALAAGEPGLVLAVDTTGWVRAAEPGTDLWVSSDGAAWTAVPPSESGLAGVGITDIAAIGGGFAATARQCDADGCTWSVWTSEDGARWSPVPGTEAAEGLESLLRLGDGLMRIADGVVLGSADGRVWSTVGALPEELASADVTDASVTGLGLTLTAHRWPGEDAVFEPPDTEVWVSADGTAWERVPDPDGLLSGAWVWQVAALGDRILVLGQVPDPNAADPAGRLQRVWIFAPGGSGS